MLKAPAGLLHNGDHRILHHPKPQALANSHVRHGPRGIQSFRYAQTILVFFPCPTGRPLIVERIDAELGQYAKVLAEAFQYSS